MKAMATNRQRKLLHFFGVEIAREISVGAAGWEIAHIMSNERNADLWDRYLYLTKDFSAETDLVLPYDEGDLAKVELPPDWNSQKETRDFQSEFVHFILSDESPFDRPQPNLLFSDMSYCFTGKFEFGERSECVKRIEALGGTFSKSVVVGLDYLVIGALGNPTWARGSYGRKIEKAVLLRREKGVPAIVSEEHWLNCLRLSLKGNP